MTAIEPLYPLSTYAVPRSSAPPQIEGKDYLVLTYDLEEDVKALELALSESEKIFQRGGRLVRVIDDVLANEPGSSQIPLRIQSISPSALRLILSEVKHFLRENQEGFKPVYPPVDLVNALLEKGRYPFLHHLRGVTQVPVLRRDGSIVQDEGYDRSTELLYQPLANFPRVREMPTEQEIKGALDLLLEVVVDFPFADPQMGQAVFLAAVFSVLGRCAFPGPVPMILVGANMPGTGKSKLADAIGLISTGQTIPRSNQLQSESEERKRITAILSKGHRLYLIDNVSGPLGGPCLDALLTSDAWADRILSKSLEVTLPNNLLVIATGNNLQVKADTARRCLLIQMLSMEEHPEARSNFHHPDLEAWIAEHQAALLTAALTILRGYVAAGRPVQAIATLGSYGGWSALIQSTVKWALGVDPGEARIPVGEGMDTDTETLQLLMSGWLEIAPNGEALTCGEAFDRIKSDSMGQSIIEAIEMFRPWKKQTTVELGHILQYFRQRLLGSANFDHAGKKTGKGFRWKLYQAKVD